MSDETVFLDGIRSDPEDITTRLVCADSLVVGRPRLDCVRQWYGSAVWVGGGVLARDRHLPVI